MVGNGDFVGLYTYGLAMEGFSFTDTSAETKKLLEKVRILFRRFLLIFDGDLEETVLKAEINLEETE